MTRTNLRQWCLLENVKNLLAASLRPVLEYVLKVSASIALLFIVFGCKFSAYMLRHRYKSFAGIPHPWVLREVVCH